MMKQPYDKMNKLEDRTMKSESAWFPLRLGDPDMTLIKITPTEVNYWDSKSGKKVVLFYMLKSIDTGKESFRMRTRKN